MMNLIRSLKEVMIRLLIIKNKNRKTLGIVKLIYIFAL